MPLPAGTGLTRRRFLARSLGAAVAVYGGSRLGLGAFEEGIAAAASGPAAPILVSIFLEGGADGLSVLSPQGDPLYKKLRPQLALAGGTAARRGRPPLLASGARRAPAALLREEGDGAAGRRLHTRRPVALHLPPLLGGRGDGGLASDGLARTVPRPGREEGQPAPGTLARRHARPCPRDRQGSRRVDLGPRPIRLLQQASLGRGRAADARGDRSHGPPARGRRAADRRQRRGAGGPPAPAADPLPVVERDLEPGAVSAVGRPVPAEARRTGRHAGRRPAAPLRRADGAGRVRHACRRADRPDPGTAADLGLAARVPARPRGARPCQPGSRAHLVGVRASRRRERRQRHRSRRGRRRLPPRNTRRREDGRRVPRPAERAGQRRQRLGHLGLPRRLRGPARAVVRGRRRRRDPAEPPPSPGRSSSHDPRSRRRSTRPRASRWSRRSSATPSPAPR